MANRFIIPLSLRLGFPAIRRWGCRTKPKPVRTPQLLAIPEILSVLSAHEARRSESDGL